MRRIFTFCFLLLSIACLGQPDTMGIFSGKYIIRCMRTLPGRTDTLVVVNDFPDTSLRLSSIDKVKVEKIDFLKPAAATAIYGPDGANGAYLITLKPSCRTFIFKDSIDRTSVAGATVVFTSAKNRNEKYQFIADENGVVVTDQLKRSSYYEMTVSAIGHTTSKQNFYTGNSCQVKDILLAREMISCDEVIVTSTFCPRRQRISCSLYCTCSGITITNAVMKKEQPDDAVLNFKVFPNPASRGSLLNLQFDNNRTKQNIVRVLSVDGKVVLQKTLETVEGKGVFRIPADPRWTAGIYFIQLLYENGRSSASQKIIIQ